VYDEMEEEYETCMLRVMRKFGKDMKDYCIDHYQESGLYDKKDREEIEFYESFHGCLEEAGTKKGKKYCDDIIAFDTKSGNKELYECYER
jgi:hypothetical protein